MKNKKPISDLVLFSDLEALKNYKFHKFTSNDNSKMIYYLKTGTLGTFMFGTDGRIQEDGTVDPSEYKKLEDISKQDGFIGFVKPNL